jgi:hypothetical protein
MSDEWVMPKVCRGQAVFFYPDGTVHPKNATLAFVREVGSQALELVGMGHICMEGVRHINDPRVQNVTREKKQPGLWDYLDSDKESSRRLEELESHVLELQRVVAEQDAAIKTLIEQPQKKSSSK